MMKQLLILITALMIVPCSVMAAEVISDPEMEAITGASGIAFGSLDSMSAREIFNLYSPEDIRGMSDEERRQLHGTTRERVDAPAHGGKTRTRDRVNQKTQDRTRSVKYGQP